HFSRSGLEASAAADCHRSGRADGRGRPGLGQYTLRQVLPAWLALLRQDAGGRVHVGGGGASQGIRRRQVTRTVVTTVRPRRPALPPAGRGGNLSESSIPPLHEVAIGPMRWRPRQENGRAVQPLNGVYE